MIHKGVNSFQEIHKSKNLYQEVHKDVDLQTGFSQGCKAITGDSQSWKADKRHSHRENLLHGFHFGINPHKENTNFLVKGTYEQ